MVSPIARFAKFLSGEDEPAAVEILPPDRVPRSRWNAAESVEARADAFAAMFLDNAPRDLRGGRPGSR